MQLLVLKGFAALSRGDMGESNHFLFVSTLMGIVLGYQESMMI